MISSGDGFLLCFQYLPAFGLGDAAENGGREARGEIGEQAMHIVAVGLVVHAQVLEG